MSCDAKPGTIGRVKLISWNTRATADPSDIARRLRALERFSPDVVALQEIQVDAGDEYEGALKDQGYAHVVQRAGTKRRHGLLVASRKWELTRLSLRPFVVPESDRGYSRPSRPADWRVTPRMLSVTVERPKRAFELHVAHVPPGSSADWVKIDNIRALHARLLKKAAIPRVLCGDFNEPAAEAADGSTLPWGSTGHQRGKYAPEARDAKVAAVRALFEDLAAVGMLDAYRLLNGYADCSAQDRPNAAWSWAASNGTRRRYDHVFASAELEPKSAKYLHQLRDRGLSDHAGLMVEFGA